MNCQSCNRNIDYRFQTNCAQCETEQAGLLQNDQLKDLPLLAPLENRPGWPRRLTNLAYIFMSSIAGLVSGAVVLYFGSAIVYIAFVTVPANPGLSCGQGNAVAAMSILLGAFLGTVGGTLFAVKNPVCKNGT